MLTPAMPNSTSPFIAHGNDDRNARNAVACGCCDWPNNSQQPLLAERPPNQGGHDDQSTAGEDQILVLSFFAHSPNQWFGSIAANRPTSCGWERSRHFNSSQF